MEFGGQKRNIVASVSERGL